MLQLDNFRKLRGYGWPGFTKMNLWRQDKGQNACAAAFVRGGASRAGRRPFRLTEILEVSRVTIEVAGSEVAHDHADRHHRRGAPNFMKIAPIIRALEARQAAGGPLRYRLVHTGQHYDARMSGDFFAQLGIPGRRTSIWRSVRAPRPSRPPPSWCATSSCCWRRRSDLCLVVGDVTSTMACAIAAQKLRVPVAHVEGGIRSGDWTMPEEINRMVTDSITNWFFTTSEMANGNLRRAGVDDDRIFFVGNTMIDTLLANLRPAAAAAVLGRRWACSRAATSWSPCTGRPMWMRRRSFAQLLARHRRRHARPAGGLSGASAHRQDPARR